MNQPHSPNGSTNGRMQWGGFGFMAGIVLGVLMGWFFAGFIGAFVRVAVVALAIVPLVLLFIAWRKVVVPFLRPPGQRQFVEQHPFSDPGYAIETRAVVRGATREPRPR